MDPKRVRVIILVPFVYVAWHSDHTWLQPCSSRHEHSESCPHAPSCAPRQTWRPLVRSSWTRRNSLSPSNMPGGD